MVMQLLLGRDMELAGSVAVWRDPRVRDSSAGPSLGPATMWIGEVVTHIHWVHHLVLEGSHRSERTVEAVDLRAPAEAGAFDVVEAHVDLTVGEAPGLDLPDHHQP